MLEAIFKKFTNDYQEIPLFNVFYSRTVDLNEKPIYPMAHPLFKEDTIVAEKLNDLVEYLQRAEGFKELSTLADSKISILDATFNLIQYQENGPKGSCRVHLVKFFKGDPVLVEKVNGLIDYIRENYNMKELI